MGTLKGSGERVARRELSEGSEQSPPDGFALDDGGAPVVPCTACGCGEFHRAPGAPWRCSACEPPTLPADASLLVGWAFCAVPGGSPKAREPLPYPPGWNRPSVVYLDQILPDIATAPIGKCVACRFAAPLTAEKLCGRCAWERVT